MSQKLTLITITIDPDGFLDYDYNREARDLLFQKHPGVENTLKKLTEYVSGIIDTLDPDFGKEKTE